mgnify:CR=1 FL=1
MQTTTEDRSTIPSGSKGREFVTDDNHSLAVVLQNLTTTLSQLTEASQAWTAVLAEWKEEQLLQEDVAEPNPDRTAESMVRPPS